MSSAAAFCKQVSLTCPVEATIYGYYPDLAANAFFAAAFGLLLIAQLGIGIWKKTWTFAIGLSLGCLSELLGYIGRLIMNNNPWSLPGIGLNVLCLVIGPSFIAAGIYLTLKHVVIYCGREYSRIRPQKYPWIFILCDVASIIIQAIGGAMGATAASGNANLLQVGDALIITGIVLQVVTMTIFGLLALEYYWRRQKLQAREKIEQPVVEKRGSDESIAKSPSSDYSPRTFRLFISAVAFAYTTILIRCIYRIVEMSGGWGGPIMRDEPSFLGLDGGMVLIATVALTVAHPGFLFTPMVKG